MMNCEECGNNMMRNACKILVGKPGGKTIILNPMRRWKNNIKVGFK
jgi:hypothetical protein